MKFVLTLALIALTVPAHAGIYCQIFQKQPFNTSTPQTEGRRLEIALTDRFNAVAEMQGERIHLSVYEMQDGEKVLEDEDLGTSPEVGYGVIIPFATYVAKKEISFKEEHSPRSWIPTHLLFKGIA